MENILNWLQENITKEDSIRALEDVCKMAENGLVKLDSFSTELQDEMDNLSSLLIPSSNGLQQIIQPLPIHELNQQLNQQIQESNEKSSNLNQEIHEELPIRENPVSELNQQGNPVSKINEELPIHQDLNQRENPVSKIKENPVSKVDQKANLIQELVQQEIQTLKIPKSKFPIAQILKAKENKRKRKEERKSKSKRRKTEETLENKSSEPEESFEPNKSSELNEESSEPNETFENESSEPEDPEEPEESFENRELQIMEYVSVDPIRETTKYFTDKQGSKFLVFNLDTLPMEKVKILREIAEKSTVPNERNLIYNYFFNDPIPFNVDPIYGPAFILYLYDKISRIRLQETILPTKNWFGKLLWKLENLGIVYCNYYKSIALPVISVQEEKIFILVGLLNEENLIGVVWVQLPKDEEKCFKFMNEFSYKPLRLEILNPPSSLSLAMVSQSNKLDSKFMDFASVEKFQQYPKMKCHPRALVSDENERYFTIFDSSFTFKKEPVHFTMRKVKTWFILLFDILF